MIYLVQLSSGFHIAIVVVFWGRVSLSIQPAKRRNLSPVAGPMRQGSSEPENNDHTTGGKHMLVGLSITICY